MTLLLILLLQGRAAMAQRDSLSIDIDMKAFFIDNEFEGRAMRGYTLPGASLTPKVHYRPIAEVCLEAGVTAMIYDGAYKYPSVAFHDLPEWKGGQYQKGAHLTPWLKMEGTIGRTTVALGSSERNHDLPIPLFNPELRLTADPEQGMRVRYGGKRYKLDVWLDWQSLIYNYDDHQEVFTAGMSHSLLLWQHQGSAGNTFSLTSPLAIMAQHRGGETEIGEKEGAQTAWNAAIGIRGEWQRPSRGIRRISAEAMVLGCRQQGKEQLWAFRNGCAAWLGCNAEVTEALKCQMGFFTAKDFVSLYGAPFFSTISVTYDGGRFSRMDAGYLNASYTYRFSPAYRLTAFGTAYLASRGSMTIPEECEPLPEGTRYEKSRFCTSYSVGVRFDADVNILLRHRQKKQ